METLFWISAGYVAYIYAGYPALLTAWAWLRQRTGTLRERRRRARPVQILPAVTVIIAARNEARRLPARIENILVSDYPLDRLQIIVASDGSTDGTAEALERFAPAVEVLRLPALGKAMALNAAVARARNPILVFADARQRFAPDVIRRLVVDLADRRIGAVSGELVIDGRNSSIGEGVGAYWAYEKWLRRREALVDSTLGVTGAVYAMHRSLWRPLPGGLLLDDVLAPMQAVLSGYRVGFDDRALAFDEAADDARGEWRRKVRTLAGNFQLLAHEPRLLVPVINPLWLQFMSHKVGRLFVPYALVLLFVASAALAAASLFFALAFAGQVLFYGLAGYGAWLDRRGRVTPVAPNEAIREAA